MDTPLGKALAAALEASLDAIVVMDDRGRIVLVNSATEQMFGYRSADMVGGRMSELIMPREMADQHDEFLATHLETGRRRMLGGRREEIARRRDGKEFPVELTASRVELDGRVLFVGYIRDLSSRRHIREAGRRAQKMEVVARMTAGIAHDFNNLLTPILGAVDGMDPGDPEQVREGLEVIAACAERGAELVSRLTSFARPDPEQEQLFDVGEALRGLEPLMRELTKRDATLSVDVTEGLTIRGARARLDQVLMNLVSNAVDALEGRGSIEIQAWMEPDDPLPVRISVEDSGSGMDENTLAHCFDPFYSTKEPGTGTGLGLATSAGIVSELGGRISASSIPGVGTQFRIELPHAEARSTAAIPLESPAPSGGRVLVVDDDERHLRMAARMLRALDFEVTEATSGSRALERMEATDGFDLLVSDYAMPGLLGNALTSAVRSAWPDCAAVLMSAHLDHSLEIRADGTVTLAKPFSKDELLRAIQVARAQAADADASAA